MYTTKSYAVSKVVWLLPLVLILLTASVYWQPNEWGYRLFMTAIALFGLGSMLLMPLKVTLTADNKLVVQGILRRTIVNIEDILVIEQNGKTTTLKHRDGKIELSYVINDLSDCCAELKACNPAIVERDGKMLTLARSPRFMIPLVVGIVLLTLVLTMVLVWLSSIYPEYF